MELTTIAFTSSLVFGILAVVCYLVTNKLDGEPEWILTTVLIILAVGALVEAFMLNASEVSYNTEHAQGVFECSRCGSNETHGFSTFWTNDGMPVNGSREYNLEHADYSYFSCDNCGHTFKVYREQWLNLSMDIFNERGIKINYVEYY
jgi:Fe2+ or Zn2+ uptake regulation protein